MIDTWCCILWWLHLILSFSGSGTRNSDDQGGDAKYGTESHRSCDTGTVYILLCFCLLYTSLSQLGMLLYWWAYFHLSKSTWSNCRAKSFEACCQWALLNVQITPLLFTSTAEKYIYPSITVMVDWALKINYLSIYLSFCNCINEKFETLKEQVNGRFTLKTGGSPVNQRENWYHISEVKIHRPNLGSNSCPVTLVMTSLLGQNAPARTTWATGCRKLKLPMENSGCFPQRKPAVAVVLLPALLIPSVGGISTKLFQDGIGAVGL